MGKGGRGIFGECLSIVHVHPSYLEHSSAHIHFDKIKGDLQLHLYNFDD